MEGDIPNAYTHCMCACALIYPWTKTTLDCQAGRALGCQLCCTGHGSWLWSHFWQNPHSWTLIWATLFSWSQISKARTLIHFQTEPDCVHSFKLPFHQNLKLNSFWGDMNTMAVLGSEELLKFMTLTAVLESPWNFLQKESLIFLWFQVWIRFKWWSVDRWRTSLDWSWYKPGHVRYKKFPSILCTMT